MNVAIKGTISWPWIQQLACSLCRKAVLSQPTSYYLRKMPSCLSAEGSVLSSIYHRYHTGETFKQKNRIILCLPTLLDASHFTDVSTLNCSFLRTHQRSNEESNRTAAFVYFFRCQVMESAGTQIYALQAYLLTYREILGSVHLIKKKHLLGTGKAKLVTIKNDVLKNQ